MRVLYCHDNIYQECGEGAVYSPGQFPYSYWQPFLDSFDHLVVAGRGAKLNGSDTSKLNESGGDRVSFVLFPNVNTPMGRLKYIRSVDRRMKQIVSDADAVIIRAVSDLGWLAYKHAKRMNKPIAMEMAACAWDSTWNHGNKLGKIYASIRWLRDKSIAKNADYVIYVSQHFLQKRYPARGEVACASNVRIEEADADILSKRLEKMSAKERGKKVPYIIGLIGNLDNRIKGVDVALSALERVEEEKPGCFIFRHLGPGDPSPYMQKAWEAGFEKRIYFDGMIKSGGAVLEWLDGIDLYLQPSYQEGVPRATVEAMSRACPVVASTAGGIPELINEKWLVSPGDEHGLAERIIEMLDSPKCQVEAAQENHLKGLDYTADILKPRRQGFWKSFSDFARTKAV